MAAPKHLHAGEAIDPGAFKYLLVAPAVFILLAMGIFPLLYAVVVSFQRLSLSDQITEFQGLLNYARVFSDERLWAAVLHTAIITIVALPIQLALGLLLAFHFLEDRPFKRIFVALLIIPSVISPMVAGSMWRLMFDDRYGPINQIIGWVIGERVSLLWTIKIPLAYPAIIVCDVWQWTPFMFIILLAALANVDQEQLDAASIDGASRWQAFRNVTIPAIWPVMMIALLIRALDLIRVFDIVWQLTRGGPGSATETISIYAYVRGFQQFDTSYVGAIVVVLIIGLSALLDRGAQADGGRAMSGRGRAIGWYATSIAITIVMLFPVYWMFAVSLKTPREIFKYPPAWYPATPQFNNFLVLFRDGDVWTIWNSFVIASTSTLIAMVIGTMCAYSIVRYRTGGENLAVWILSQRLLPPIAVVFPIFLIYAQLGLTDTYAGLILIYVAFALPYVIWVMRGYIQDIPVELEESAMVDGATRWQVLWRVVIPVARNGIFATAVFAFIFSWNEFLFALVLTRTQVRDLSGAGQPVFRRAVDVLGEDLGDVGARHAAGLLRRRDVPALSRARHLARRCQGLRRAQLEGMQ